MTAGALTAAVVSIEPSKTATLAAAVACPRSDTFAKCSPWGVSRRSSKRALTPTRSVAIRVNNATTLSRWCSEAMWAMPTCRSGSSRQAENTSRLRSLDSISGRAS